MFSSFHSSPLGSQPRFSGIGDLPTYPEEKVKDTRLAPARHPGTGGRLQRSGDTPQVLGGLCVWLMQLCVVNRGGERRASLDFLSCSLWGYVSSPPILCLTPSRPNRIETPLPLPARSLKIQVLIRLLHHRYNCRFFLKKASSKRQMFGLIKNSGENLQLHQGIIYWTNILIKRYEEISPTLQGLLL